MTVTYTDDPRDPCGYCCGWADDPGDEFGQNAVAIHADGTPIERLYYRGHKRCLAMVAAYEKDHEGDVS